MFHYWFKDWTSCHCAALEETVLMIHVFSGINTFLVEQMYAFSGTYFIE